MTNQLGAAIARIRQANGKVVGAGFLVSDKYILTCAHVVNAALSRHLNTTDVPNQEICLDFPLVASGKILRGRVVRWIPVQPGSSISPETGADIAKLELEDFFPEKAKPVRLVKAEDLWNHGFRVFGFPEGRAEGVWTDGIIKNPQANGRVHIEVSHSSAYSIEPGFSGSPVWDEKVDGVAGMTVAIDPLRPKNRAAFMTPTTQLINACPELVYPYRGLFAFTEQDSKFFFGRETFTEELVKAVHRQSLVAVIGASGSGKSSVVFAGLIPQLRSEEGWLIESFRPGDRPFYNLAAKLISLLETTEIRATEELREVNNIAQALQQGDFRLRDVITRSLENNSGSRLLLIADQFEELYTLCQDDSERQRFLAQLLEAVNQIENLKLVLTLRADFFGYALSYRPFADALQDSDLKLGPMNREELQEVIEKPAKKLEVSLQPGLTKLILKAVENEPGYLPLLEFALEQMWKQQQNGQLTHEAYEEIGGVKQALAKYAEEQFKSLSKKNRERAQRVFIQLVRPGEGTEDTRRLATRDEVGEDNWDLVTRLASARLVVTGFRLVATECDEPKVEETVEIVHEALIREWERLRDWMEINREFRTWQERLKTRMQEWKEGKGELLSKTRLKIAEEWRQRRGQELSQEQKDFILKSRQRQIRNRWLVRGIASLIGIIGLWTGAEFYKKSCDVGERVGQDCFRFIITSGDSKLFVGTTNLYLQDGIEDFNSAFLDLNFLGKFVLNQEKFKEAQKDFQKAKEVAPYDPIPLIYYNNAIALSRGNLYKLAVVVPVDDHEEIAKNMLRGVASAQKEFNEKRKTLKAPLLQIVIANDKNNQDIAKRVAERLSRENVLGIVGHRSSGSSLAAIPIYKKNGISMVSPTSGSTRLDDKEYKGVFFRGVASNKEAAKKFYQYAKNNCLNKNQNNQVLLLYDEKDEYSKNLKEEFDNHIEKKLEKRFDVKAFYEFLKTAKENLKGEIKDKIEKNNVKCAILMPGTRTTSVAISIVYAQKELFDENPNLSKERKIRLLSGLALHNDETLKKDGDPLKEGLIVVSPEPKLDVYIKKTLYEEWGGNISWRTYTSYKATQFLIDGLKQLDGKKEKSTSEKREIIRNYLKAPESPLPKQEYCLIKLEDTQKSKPEAIIKPKCLELKDTQKSKE